VTYLVAHGVAQARITATGFGGTKPVASNTTEDGRAKNRRIEFRVVM
jgi:OOP family OmpA-OmpF porin